VMSFANPSTLPRRSAPATSPARYTKNRDPSSSA
jgi:hypothetical protein